MKNERKEEEKKEKRERNKIKEKKIGLKFGMVCVWRLKVTVILSFYILKIRWM